MRAHDFQQQARRGRTGEIADAVVDRGCQVGQLRAGKTLRLGGKHRSAVGGRGDEAGLDSAGHGLQDHQIAQAVEQIDSEATRVVAGLDDMVHHREEAGFVLVGEGVDGVVKQRNIGDTQKRPGEVIGQAIGPGTGQQLVQQGQRIARGTTARLNDHGVYGVLDMHALGRDGALQQALHGRRGQQAEGIVVGTRANGADNFLRLRGREDENDVLRRLLHYLEQRVSAGGRNHMRLVDDEDAVARFGRCIVGAIAQLAHVFHAIMRGGVKLRHVQVSGAAGGQGDAGIALATRRRGRPVLAVERTGHNSRRGGLAAAARAGKEIGVVDAPRIEGGG